MPDFAAEMEVSGYRIEGAQAGYRLDRLPEAVVLAARIVAGLLQCRIVDEALVEPYGGRGRQLWGAPLGTFVLGAHTVGRRPDPATLGRVTLGGRVRGG